MLRAEAALAEEERFYEKALRLRPIAPAAPETLTTPIYDALDGER